VRRNGIAKYLFLLGGALFAFPVVHMMLLLADRSQACDGRVAQRGDGMKRLLSALAVLGLFVGAAHAGLLGTQMTGSLSFCAGCVNSFDPVNGFVPDEDLNSAGTTVTVSASATEFGFNNAITSVTANFTDTDITIDVVPLQGGMAPAFQMIFTSSDEFDSGYLTGVGQFFSFTLGALNGLGNPTTITANFTGGTLPIGTQMFTITETVAEPSPIPEPATLALLGIGLASVGFSRRKQ